MAWFWRIRIGGFLLNFFGVYGLSPSHVTVVGFLCGSAMVLALVLTVIWAFFPCSILLRISPLFSSWDFPCSDAVRRLARWLALVGAVLLCIVWPLSYLTYAGPWFWLAWCLVMDISCRLPILACWPLSICLGLAVCFLWPVDCLLTSLGGYVMISRVFCLGCSLPVLSASLLCCRRTLLLLFPLVMYP